MINIDNCTLFAVDCIQPELAIKALEKTCEHINFKEVIFFSDVKPTFLNEKFKFQQIEKLNNLDDYSEFMLSKLTDFIDTEFCFSIHHDGFVVNPELWSNDFIKYDYIGAPWPSTSHFILEGKRVGNGGVSIRSKKLMEYVKTIPQRGHEDTVICVNLRNHLEEKGFTFAPLDVAAKFSVELTCDDLDQQVSNTFAFHGKHTPEHIAEIKKLIKSHYRDDLIKMNVEELRDWIRNKAGSQQPDYFFCNTPGNLQLQQVPEEYSEFLNIIRNQNIKTYLELGVGNGGSFFVNSIFLQKTAIKLHCVDNIAYRDTHIKQSETKIQKKVDMLQEMFINKDVFFYNMSTDDFFKQNKGSYDCIFIDADHSYEGVAADYKNAIKIIEKHGIIILHDIANTDTGVYKLWNELKEIHSNVKEFKYKINPNIGYACGIGIIYL
jgi:predicted O-methyltransferase YrrM